MKRKILIIFYCLMLHIGIISLFYWLNRHKKRIFTYHNIIPDYLFDYTPHLGVSHTQSIFETQIQLIKKRFLINGEQRCLFTFDDGYLNQLTIGAEVLNQHYLKGIFFISLQAITTCKPLVIDKVLFWISYVPPGNYEILEICIKITNNNREYVASYLYDQLLKSYKVWHRIEDELNLIYSFSSLCVNDQLKFLRLTPLKREDLADLIKNGHTIGAHSWAHLPLATLPEEVQEEDFIKCISFAKEYCNSLLYSYPFGTHLEVNQLTTQLCEKYGFSKAYVNTPTYLWKGVNSNYIIPRINLPNERNKYILEAKLSGFEFVCKEIITLIFK